MQKEYEELCIIKGEVNKRLADGEEQLPKELFAVLCANESLSELVKKDNQLIKLKCFCVLGMEEYRKLPLFGGCSTVFYEINSLEKLEERFLRLEFWMLRLELPMDNEQYEELLEYIITYKVSGIVLNFMLQSVTENYLENVRKLAKLLLNKGQNETAACLLWKAGVDVEGL